jgi:hypothetical protein
VNRSIVVFQTPIAAALALVSAWSRRPRPISAAAEPAIQSVRNAIFLNLVTRGPPLRPLSMRTNPYVSEPFERSTGRAADECLQ